MYKLKIYHYHLIQIILSYVGKIWFANIKWIFDSWFHLTRISKTVENFKSRIRYNLQSSSLLCSLATCCVKIKNGIFLSKNGKKIVKNGLKQEYYTFFFILNYLLLFKNQHFEHTFIIFVIGTCYAIVMSSN